MTAAQVVKPASCFILDQLGWLRVHILLITRQTAHFPWSTAAYVQYSRGMGIREVVKLVNDLRAVGCLGLCFP